MRRISLPPQITAADSADVDRLKSTDRTPAAPKENIMLMLTSLADARMQQDADPRRAKDLVFARAQLVASSTDAFISLASHPAGEPQVATTRRGLLSGIPFAVKDNIDAAGLPTTAGTKALNHNFPRQNAHVVQQLLDAGAYLVGKTNMHELGLGVTSNNRFYGPVRHPGDRSLSPGGSSGGSAVAVASGVVPFALGTDTGGSVRIPAAFCGIVGFRPTVGRYSTEGLIQISWTRDTIGVLAGCVADIIAVDDVLTPNDSMYTELDSYDLRLGVPRSDFYDDLDPEVADVVEAALEELAQSGVKLIEVDMGAPCEDALKSGFPIVDFETEKAVTKYLESLPVADRPTFEMLAATAASPDVHRLLLQLLTEPVSPEAYAAALELRDRLRETYRDVFSGSGVQALIYPSVVTTAPPISDENVLNHNGRTVDVLRTLVKNATPAAVAGTPAISVPCGTTTRGMSVGLTLDGLMGSDRVVLSAAATVEAILRRPANDGLRAASAEQVLTADKRLLP